MDFNGINELIDKINSTDISYFEYTTNDGQLKMDKSLIRNISSGVAKTEDSTSEVDKEVSINETIVNMASEVKEVKNSTLDQEELKIIKSPMVGTFYSTPSPENPSFVKVGDSVGIGDVLCIIEAMKLMNEIDSEVNGIIKQILVKDGDMVEYGQPLFKVKED